MRAGWITAGIVLLLLGFVFVGTFFLAALGALLILIGIILIIAGAVSSEPRPQVVVHQQPQPQYYPYPSPQAPYYPPPPGNPTPVTVNVQQAAAAIPPPQIMRRCHFCNTVFPESQAKCPSCGASF